jgi:hypothetical protein
LYLYSMNTRRVLYDVPAARDGARLLALGEHKLLEASSDLEPDEVVRHPEARAAAAPPAVGLTVAGDVRSDADRERLSPGQPETQVSRDTRLKLW